MRLRHFTAAACVAGLVTLAVSAVQGEEDHLEGYKVKDPTKFQPSGTYTVDNQFGTATCQLKKAKFFLVQSEKNNGNDPRGGPAGHFVCYTAKCSGGLPTSNTELDDQFGTHTLEAKKTQLVCVPADEHVCGDGELDPGETCDGTAGGPCIGSCQPDCTCPVCTGFVAGGFCWFLGSFGQSCASVCAGQGLVYSPGTASYAGSGGNLSNCFAVLTGLGMSCPGGGEGPGFGGVGCFKDAFFCTRDLDPTTSTASAGYAQRACACQ